jgi:preprotein translocase subunit SecG
MSAPALILSIVYVLLGAVLTAAVMLQSGKSDGLSGMTNGGDTFLARNKARSLDARLAKATKWLAIALVVLTLVVGLMVG